MFPLIEIKSVPIEIQVKTKSASLEYTRGEAEMEISRSENGVDIKSGPIKLQFDSFESQRSGAARGASVTPATQNEVKVAAKDSRHASYQAAVSASPGGALQLIANVNKAPEEIQADEAARSAMEEYLDKLPPTGDAIDLEQFEGTMEIRYEMDMMNLGFKIGQGELTFTPGDIEISVEQRPEVVVKYVGGPIYVPPSADPNYEPLDVKA